MRAKALLTAERPRDHVEPMVNNKVALVRFGDFVRCGLCSFCLRDKKYCVYFSTVTPKNGFKKDKSARTCRPTDVFSRA